MSLSVTDQRLAQRIAELSRPLTPVPTGVELQGAPIEGIRAVLFDIYGTLLVSASGDISLADPLARGDMAIDALAVCGLHTAIDRDGVVERLHEAIATQQALRKSEGIPFPEVDLVAAWRSLPWTETPDDAALHRLAIEFECRVNPVWPMPGAAELLAELRRNNVVIGIVSNAQFFTPLTMLALLGKPLADLGFDASLCLWSYEHLQAKPGRFLYEQAAARLASIEIEPAQAMMIGNDLRNDVAPAAAVGFRTALFAGDARSLRMREGDLMVQGVRADAVLTELEQTLRILRLAPP